MVEPLCDSSFNMSALSQFVANDSLNVCFSSDFLHSFIGSWYGLWALSNPPVVDVTDKSYFSLHCLNFLSRKCLYCFCYLFGLYLLSISVIFQPLLLIPFFLFKWWQRILIVWIETLYNVTSVQYFALQTTYLRITNMSRLPWAKFIFQLPRIQLS